MRFIVDMFRYVIFAFCGLMIIGAVLLLLKLSEAGDAGLPPGLVIAAAIAAFVFLVLNLGGIAILVSIHDRHVELVEEATERNVHLAQVAAAIERSSRSGDAR